MSEARDRWLGLASLGACGLLLGAASPAAIGEALAAGALAVAALALPTGGSAVAAGLGYGWLAAAAVARGGPAVQMGAMALALAQLVVMAVRPGRWPHRLLGSVALGGGLAALVPLAASWVAGAPLSRAPVLGRWPTLVACFVAAVLFFSRERGRPAPRWLLAAGLSLAAALGLARLGSARHALAEAAGADRLEAFVEAGRRAARIGWTGGERRARLGESRARLRDGDPRGALEALPPERVRGPEAWVGRAEAWLSLGEGSRAMDALRSALVESGGRLPPLSPESSARVGLWQARRGEPRAALERLAEPGAVAGPALFVSEAAGAASRSGALERARDLARRAEEADPRGPHGLCAVVEWEQAPERARRCLEVAPGHAASLAVLASLGEAGAAEVLAAGAELPARETVYGGVVALRGVGLGPARVPPGGAAPWRVLLEVRSGLAPGEEYQAFVHLAGPVYREVGGAPLVPTWVRGVRHLHEGAIAVPADVPPGLYRVYLGFQSVGGVRLMPLGLPGHVQYLDVGQLEVAP